MTNEIDYKNCINDNSKIVREFYNCIYTNNTEQVRYLLNNYAWLKDILQTSWIADMQFYDFDEKTRKYNVYFPSIELLDLLKNYVDIVKSVNYPIVYSSGIQDNASYMSSSMQNKNAIKWEYEDYKNSRGEYQITLLEMAKKERHSECYAEYDIASAYKDNDDDMQLTQKEYRDLMTMGKSWFVSRMYHDFIDENHNNWKLTPTGFKMGTFVKITRTTQKKYLQNILSSNTIMLSKNVIGLSGAEIKRMAQEMLEKWDGIINVQKTSFDTLENIGETAPFASLTFSEQESSSKYVSKHSSNIDNENSQEVNSIELTPKEERDLQTIGKSWFVSRMYHDFIDKNHDNWELTQTGFKMGTFPKITRIIQKKYLQNILKSNVTMLGKNKIGLSGTEVLRMAQELLDKWDEAKENPKYT